MNNQQQKKQQNLNQSTIIQKQYAKKEDISNHDHHVVMDDDNDSFNAMNLLNAPRYHRPQSLSIVTIGPATLNHLQFYHSNKMDIVELPESDEDNLEEDGDDNHESKPSSTISVDKPIVSRHNSKASSKFSDADLKLRKIVYGQNDPEDMIDEEEEEEQEEDCEEPEPEKLVESSTSEVPTITITSAGHGLILESKNLEEISSTTSATTTTTHFKKLGPIKNNNLNHRRQQQHQQQQRQNHQMIKSASQSSLVLHQQQNHHQQNQKNHLDSISLISRGSTAISMGNKSILKIPTSPLSFSGDLRQIQSQQQLQQQPTSISPQLSDKYSIGECSIVNSNRETAYGTTTTTTTNNKEFMNKLMNTRLIKLLSIMYSLLIIILGAIITIGDMDKATNDYDHLYNILITSINLCFLIFIHFDVQKHKRFVLKWQKQRKEMIESPFKLSSSSSPSSPSSSPNQQVDPNINCDSLSVTTAVIFNNVIDHMKINDDDIDDQTKKQLNAYRFITGKHSGSFYLKIGMTLFCMGSIVHQGINLAFQLHYFTIGADECKNTISLIVYLLRCISAFYQLYIAFRYSNLIINRHHYLVRFGLMHMVGSSISFWFSTIVEEAVHGYMEKIEALHGNHTDHVFLETAYHHHLICSNKTLKDFESIDAIPFFYPFSIEFNIILASVWYIIWANVENKDPNSEMHNLREEINEDHRTGTVDIVYRSNISISADCHASNLGMFGGLFSLLLTLITIIIFFTTIKHSQYNTFGITVYTGQSIFLTTCCLLAVAFAYQRTRTLDVSKHLDSAQTSMDDFLLMIPLPFYFIHHTLCIYSELLNFSMNSIAMAICYAMNLIQITLQTPFIIDGIRRCSNDRKYRYKKPGKQLITFAIIINVTIWILVTFEIKSVDKYHSMPDKFGKFPWMIILDTCLPLMLFYRFHSSVCLSDMWKHCYEKDEH